MTSSLFCIPDVNFPRRTYKQYLNLIYKPMRPCNPAASCTPAIVMPGWCVRLHLYPRLQISVHLTSAYDNTDHVCSKTFDIQGKRAHLISELNLDCFLYTNAAVLCNG